MPGLPGLPEPGFLDNAPTDSGGGGGVHIDLGQFGIDQNQSPSQGLPGLPAPGFLQNQPSLSGDLPAVAGGFARGVGDVADMAQFVQSLGTSRFLPTSARDDTDWLAQEVGVDPKAEAKTTPGILAQEVARFAPSVFMGEGSLAPRVANTIMAGLGSGSAKAAGLGPIGQFVGALAGGLTPTSLRSVWDKLPNLTQGSQGEAAQSAAREIARSSASNPDAAIQALQDFQAKQVALPYAQRVAQTNLANYQRTAEIAQDPGLATLEKSLRDSATVANPELQQMEGMIQSGNKDREAARQAIFAKQNPNPMQEEQVTNILRNRLEDTYTAADDTVKAHAGNAFLGQEDLATSPAKRAIWAARQQYDPYEIEEFDPAFNRLVDKFTNLDPESDFKQLQAFSRQFGRWAGAANKPNATTVDAMTAGIAGKMRAAIDQTILKSVDDGELPYSQARAYYQMKGARAEQGAQFERGAVQKILQKEPFGAYKLTGEQAVTQAVGSPEAARQVVGSLKKNTPSIDALRGSLLSRIFESSTSKTTGKFLPASFKSQLQKFSDVAPEVLKPKTIQALNLIGDDLVAEGSTDRIAFSKSAGQSATAGKQSTIEALQGAINDKSTTLIRKIPVAGTILDFTSALAGNSIAARRALINKELAKFVLEPGNAEKMLAPVEQGRNGLEAFARHLAQITPQATAKAASGTQGATPSIAPQMSSVLRKLPAAASMLRELSPTISDARADVPPSAFKRVMPLPTKITPELLDAVKQVESGGKNSAVSGAGAKGPYQLMDKTGKTMHDRLGIKEAYDPFNEKQARKIAEALLAENLNEFGGDMHKALTAYNSGWARVKSGNLGPQGKAYASKVESVFEKLKA